MSKKGYSRPGLFGEIYHYDENGRKTGKSARRIFGGYTNYDENGRYSWHSNPLFRFQALSFVPKG